MLNVGESGLSTRLFTPVASLCPTPVTIEGRGSLLRRPMQMMFEPLRRLGVRVRDNGGFLPIEVCGPIQGGEAEVDGSVSSQFITGLLLALPLARRDTSLHVRGAVSTPYLDMTLDTAARFGIEISQRDYEEFYIPGRQRYRSTYFSIEGDWSAAAMLLVAGATAGEVTVRNVSMLSKQADTAICTALVRAGAAVINEEDSVTALHRPLRAFEFDATNCPDLFPALAALAAAADGVSVIRGTSRLEYKECNRSEAIREEYAKLGIEVDTSEEDRDENTRRKGPRGTHAEPRRPPHGHVAGRRRPALGRSRGDRGGRERRQKLSRVLRGPGTYSGLKHQTAHEPIRTQFPARHLGRVARTPDRHFAGRRPGGHPALGGGLRRRPRATPQRSARHDAEARTRTYRRSCRESTTATRRARRSTIEFANTNTHSQDYSTVMRHYRPSHADLVAYHKFAGFNDPRGGGHFSARLTVALVAAGVVAKKMLPAGIRLRRPG